MDKTAGSGQATLVVAMVDPEIVRARSARPPRRVQPLGDPSPGMTGPSRSHGCRRCRGRPRPARRARSAAPSRTRHRPRPSAGTRPRSRRRAGRTRPARRTDRRRRVGCRSPSARASRIPVWRAGRPDDHPPLRPTIIGQRWRVLHQLEAETDEERDRRVVLVDDQGHQLDVRHALSLSCIEREAPPCRCPSGGATLVPPV